MEARLTELSHVTTGKRFDDVANVLVQPGSHWIDAVCTKCRYHQYTDRSFARRTTTGPSCGQARGDPLGSAAVTRRGDGFRRHRPSSATRPSRPVDSRP